MVVFSPRTLRTLSAVLSIILYIGTDAKTNDDNVLKSLKEMCPEAYVAPIEIMPGPLGGIVSRLKAPKELPIIRVPPKCILTQDFSILAEDTELPSYFEEETEFARLALTLLVSRDNPSHVLQRYFSSLPATNTLNFVWHWNESELSLLPSSRQTYYEKKMQNWRKIYNHVAQLHPDITAAHPWEEFLEAFLLVRSRSVDSSIMEGIVMVPILDIASHGNPPRANAVINDVYVGDDGEHAMGLYGDKEIKKRAPLVVNRYPYSNLELLGNYGITLDCDIRSPSKECYVPTLEISSKSGLKLPQLPHFQTFEAGLSYHASGSGLVPAMSKVLKEEGLSKSNCEELERAVQNLIESDYTLNADEAREKLHLAKAASPERAALLVTLEDLAVAEAWIEALRAVKDEEDAESTWDADEL